ncbi:MAG: ABC transporter ATP-binding protein [Prosthecobacter sp.]|uniref:ABC transporter ATP-binding protein n=1 Tax=Prosthecobacter sp. TaxID=1965333 RepID=UPI00390076BE
MTSPIIRVENLGKCYRIHHESRERYTALRDVITRKAKRLFRPSTINHEPSTEEDFWALKDVSFEVNQGEVVGIIGRNGAGKSTLLKILSRITEPTKGRITLNGRIASLLEVGTGFHPELTGRENIFLNGAILGMTKAEIKSKFDEIVAFAEVERFLDTPVKRYSSGMYVRLAFAVAAHLEPEILVVDEVLAVGDAEFQKKCLGKMGEVAKGGRTVLFVSHQMAAVQRLCSRGIVLADGRIALDGNVDAAVKSYLHAADSLAVTRLDKRIDRKGNGRLHFHAISMHDAAGREIPSPLCGAPASIQFHYESDFAEGIHEVDVAIKLRNETGGVVTAFANIPTGQGRLAVTRRGYFECRWPKTLLRSGAYVCALYCAVDGDICDWMQDAFTIMIEDGDFYGTGVMLPRDHGDILCEHQWESHREQIQSTVA